MTSSKGLGHAIVVGASGFIGRHLSLRLASMGVPVVAVSRRQPVIPIAGVQWKQLDILRRDQCESLFFESPMALRSDTVVFHLAGASDAALCRRNPANALAVNVGGTVNVLEACRRAELHRVVFASSGQVYDVTAGNLADENAPTRVRNIYTASKLAAEAVVIGLTLDFGLSAEIVRLANVYGPGAGSNSVVGLIVQQVSAGKPVVLRSLRPCRDFIHVDDVVSALLALANHGGSPGYRVTNVGSGVKTSIRLLAETACHAGQVPDNVRETDPLDDPDDIPALGIARIIARTGWKPRVSLEDGLRATLGSFENNRT